jgi:hypothetical protein
MVYVRILEFARQKTCQDIPVDDSDGYSRNGGTRRRDWRNIRATEGRMRY